MDVTADISENHTILFNYMYNQLTDNLLKARGYFCLPDPHHRIARQTRRPQSPNWTHICLALSAATALRGGVSARADGLLEVPNARLPGLRLEDGALILKAERGEAAVQMRIADGAGFDPAGGIA